MEEMDSSSLHTELARFAPNARTLLVAVSGGGDSVALLRLLHRIAGRPYTLHVAHFDHALRPESAEEAQFVRVLCDDLELPLTFQRIDVGSIAAKRGWNLEDAARRLRYPFLLRTAKRVGADAVLTAHTEDDNAETVLMQLLRGSAFLRGISERQGNVVRPLLTTSRQALRAYLNDLGQSWLEDPSNLDLGRTRAWVRHVVLPLLEARYPAVQAVLSRQARVQRGAGTFLEEQARSLIGVDGLELASLRRAPPALTLTALHRFLQEAGIRTDLALLERLQSALAAEHPVRLALPRAKTARLAYGRLEVIPSAQSQESSPAEPATTLPVEVDSERLDLEKLFYRTRTPGDWMRLAGGRKKLSDVLIDAKVPREARDTLRLLAVSPTGPSEILWVEGVATAARASRSQKALETPLQPDIDEGFMARALELARQAAQSGEVPVGALIVREGVILAQASNTTREDHDPTAHAELKAVRSAAHALGDWRLEGCTLYVTLEPCPMCLGAILTAHVPRLVYGAVNRREGALGGVADLRQHDWKRSLEVRGGVKADEASRLLSAFFGSRRAEKTSP